MPFCRYEILRRPASNTCGAFCGAFKSELLGTDHTAAKASEPSAGLKVRVVPGSSRDQIVGWLGDALKIKVTAPPEKGRANEVVVELPDDLLGLPADAIAVASGHSSPSMVIAIKGTDDGAIKQVLG